MNVEEEMHPKRPSTKKERKYFPPETFNSSNHLSNSDDGATSTDCSSENSEVDEDISGSRNLKSISRSAHVIAAAAPHSDSITPVDLNQKNKNNSSENNFLYVYQNKGFSGILSWTQNRAIPFLSGVTLSLNFLIFWAIPVAGMGSLYKHTPLKKFLQPIYIFLESHSAIRNFASSYVYENPQHADFFVILMLLCCSAFISAGTMFYVQLRTGALPAWLIAAYYCSWVGIGGSMMGTAYGLSHKEGHNRGMYKKWIRNSVGNFVENWIGVMFGNVPYNFTTSHVFVHHRLDGSIGDSFYLWDFDRSSLVYYMMYVHRILLHMTGYSSIVYFNANNKHILSKKLQDGVCIYWGVAAGILAITRSFSFLFWFYIEPLLCMTFFLALLNIGFHGFIEFDAGGKSIPCVNSTTIIDGEDDFFGEDDHMAHHYNSKVYYRDLPALQEAKRAEFKQHRASVFRGLSIVELSIFIVLRLWDKLADHYVDYSDPSEQLTRDQVKALLKSRAQRCETNYDAYQAFAKRPDAEAREQFLRTMQQQQQQQQ